MKRKILVCSLLALIALAVGTHPAAAQVAGSAGDPILWVYPTGVHPTDVDNVQWALDNVASPGTVVMKATAMSGNPLAFDFGGEPLVPNLPGTGGVLKLLRPDVTLTGDGWDNSLNEPRTKILGGGGPFTFSPSYSGLAMVFAVRAPGVTIRNIKLATSFAYTGIFVVSTTEWPASDHPVIFAGNHISVLNYGVISAYTAAFPVRIEENRIEANTLTEARWMGFTLRPITTPNLALDYDEPAVPEDASGNPARQPWEATGNVMVKTAGSTSWSTVTAYGWANYYMDPAIPNADAELGCRRYRESAALPYIYQCAPGDNGPVLIAGNTIIIDSPDAGEAIDLGVGDGGLNHAVVVSNILKGQTAWGITRYPWGHDTAILNNDLSGLKAAIGMDIEAADTFVAGNVMGTIEPLEMALGLPTPALMLYSAQYYAARTPKPRPVENCVIMWNDYRLSGAEGGTILLASRMELEGAAGGEVKNNIVFESGGFPPGTGDAFDHVTLLDEMINPATGLPYVHDNRIIGLPAAGLEDPGVGRAVRRINEILKTLKEQRRGQR